MRWAAQKKSVWHRVFAWLPVAMNSSHQKVWLEPVYRRHIIHSSGTRGYFIYETPEWYADMMLAKDATKTDTPERATVGPIQGNDTHVRHTHP